MLRYYYLVLIILKAILLFGNVLSENIEKIKIPKCCVSNQVMYLNDYLQYECKGYDKNIDSFVNISVYDDTYTKNIEKKFNDIFSLQPDMKPDAGSLVEYFPPDNCYLLTNGDLYEERPHDYPRWLFISQSHYCVDYDSELSMFRIYISSDANGPQHQNTPNISIGLIISSVFLFLVLVVYMLLPSLRNLSGKVLISYVVSLLLAFIFLTTLVEVPETSVSATTCICLATSIYYFFMSSFCWMNVMSYDIWWTFRGYAKARKIHRRGTTFKFCMYSLYAWGVPFAMSVTFVVIHNSSLEGKPWIVKPIPENECYPKEGRKLLYFNVPMLIIIICNWIFFLMTAFNIWRLHRATAVLDSEAEGTPAAHRSQRQRFCVYLKLSVVMGVSWIMEAISSLYPGLKLWAISDWYNALIGVTMFLIFVCKKTIYDQLKKRLFERQRSSAKTSSDGTYISA